MLWLIDGRDERDGCPVGTLHTADSDSCLFWPGHGSPKSALVALTLQWPRPTHAASTTALDTPLSHAPSTGAAHVPLASP
jgi:hypothetical protein